MCSFSKIVKRAKSFHSLYTHSISKSYALPFQFFFKPEALHIPPNSWRKTAQNFSNNCFGVKCCSTL